MSLSGGCNAWIGNSASSLAFLWNEWKFRIRTGRKLMQWQALASNSDVWHNKVFRNRISMQGRVSVIRELCTCLKYVCHLVDSVQCLFSKYCHHIIASNLYYIISIRSIYLMDQPHGHANPSIPSCCPMNLVIPLQRDWYVSFIARYFGIMGRIQIKVLTTLPFLFLIFLRTTF